MHTRGAGTLNGYFTRKIAYLKKILQERELQVQREQVQRESSRIHTVEIHARLSPEGSVETQLTGECDGFENLKISFFHVKKKTRKKYTTQPSLKLNSLSLRLLYRFAL